MDATANLACKISYFVCEKVGEEERGQKKRGEREREGEEGINVHTGSMNAIEGGSPE